MPRRSGRHWETPVRPGNVYGEKRTPTEITRDIKRQTYWRNTVEGSSRSRNQIPVRQPENPVPGPSSQPTPNIKSDTDDSDETDKQSKLSKLAWEGGVRFMNFLLAKAVPPHGSSPNPLNVRDWTFRDILQMPTTEQREWKAACRCHAQVRFLI